MSQQQCEFQYGVVDMALGIAKAWTDDNWRCRFPAHERWMGQWYCPTHIDILMEQE